MPFPGERGLFIPSSTAYETEHLWQPPIKMLSGFQAGGPDEFVQKNGQKCSPARFSQKIIHHFSVGKSTPKIWANSKIYKNCPLKKNAQ
jgi:hypothetical protein